MAVKIVQGTNPQLSFKLPIETATITAFKMTISDYSAVKILKDTPTYSADTATVQLSAEETKALNPGNYNVQLRIKTQGGKIYATPFLGIEILKLADQGEI